MRQVHPQLNNVYTCVGTFSFFEVDQNLVSVVGQHLPGMTAAQVAHLEIAPGQTTPFIPFNFNQFLPGIQHISWRGSTLNEISLQELQQFAQLQSFIATGNRLTRLPANLFMGNTNLQFVEFSQEQLVTIENSLLGNLNALTTARFLQNPCVNEQANTRQDVINLSTRLHILCPLPGETTTMIPTPPPPGDCPIGCQSQINFLTQENQQLRTITADLNSRLTRIETFVCQNVGLLC